jgi:N-acetylglucosamine-6-phosphate deacetylase
VSLVTDAMAAAGMADGAYRIGPLDVEVSDGVAHLVGTDTIAGSTATMDRLFAFAVNRLVEGGVPRDDAMLLAVRQSSVNPARALGLPSPLLRTGAVADLVVLDEDLAVSGVLYRGEWVPR